MWMLREKHCKENNQQVQRPWDGSTSGCSRHSQGQSDWDRMRKEGVGEGARQVMVQSVWLYRDISL